MISGDSGSGKTETCFELEKLGFRFVADDAVEFLVDSNVVYGRRSDVIAGIANRKGIGLFEISNETEPVKIVLEVALDENYPMCHFLMSQNDIVRERIEECAPFRAAEQIHILVKGLV